MNVFEGFRRILRVVQAGWVLTVVILAIGAYPNLQATYETFGTAEPFRLSTHCSGKVHQEEVSRPINFAGKVSVTLCFRPKKKLQENMVVPFSEENIMWEDDIRRRVSEFQLPAAELQDLSTKWWSTLQNVGMWTAAGLFGGVALLELLGFILGWIIRGFLGIPRGRDVASS